MQYLSINHKKITISSIVIGLKKLLFSSKSPTKLPLNSLFAEFQ